VGVQEWTHRKENGGALKLLRLRRAHERLKPINILADSLELIHDRRDTGIGNIAIGTLASRARCGVDLISAAAFSSN
jgi:hypothetical protein